MFVEPPQVPGTQQARPSELVLAKRIAERIARCDDVSLHAMAYRLDSRILPHISAEAMLLVAAAIEARAPWMIENMPRLQAHQGKLRRAADMAAAFNADHLSRLRDALRREASRS
jgi:hypothetical protein